MRRSALAAAAAVALLVLLPAAPASAHAYLVSSTPAVGATVSDVPDAVVLTFDEGLVDLGSDSIVVTDAAGRHHETGCAAVDGREVRVGVALGATGAYTVAYRVVSDDGHVVDDAYTFRYTGPTVSAGSATGPSCAAAAAQVPTRTAGTPAVVVAAIAVSGGVLLAVLVLVVVVVVRARREPDGTARAARGGGGPESQP